MSFFLAMMVLLSGMQVFFRYFVNSSLAWSEEMSRYCYVWSGFLSVSYCIRRAAALKLDFVMSLIPKVAQRIIALLASAFCLDIYAIFLDSAIVIIQKTAQIQQVSAALRMPMQVVYMAAVVGFALAIIRSFQMGWLEIAAMVREAREASAKPSMQREGGE